MKEFWLQPDENLSEETVRRLIDQSKPDAVIVENPASRLSTKVASRTRGGDIFITAQIDEMADARKDHVSVALEVTVRDRKDYERVSYGLDHRPDYLLIDCPDWKIIPLENLIATARGQARLIAKTKSFEESRTALNILELGADGIALVSRDPTEILKTRRLVSDDLDQVTLSIAKITSIKPIGTGARACVDTCEILSPGEGLLTGSSSQGLFLVEGEVHSNPHVNPRPFRVNAGPISLYVLAPDGKTRYLSELAAGETVVAVDRNGRSRKVDVARVKIERRPMVLVEASVEAQMLRTILQNAETVRLVAREGSKPVSEIKAGDQVLVRLERGGRHFGTMVEDEMIIEK